MTTPCYYCEDNTECDVCIHGKADADDLRAALKARAALEKCRDYISMLLTRETAFAFTRDQARDALEAADQILGPREMDKGE